MANDIDIPYDDRAFGAALHESGEGWILALLEGASLQSLIEDLPYGRNQVSDAIPGGNRSLDDPEKVAEYFLVRLEAAGYTAERVQPDRECVAAWSLTSPQR